MPRRKKLSVLIRARRKQARNELTRSNSEYAEQERINNIESQRERREKEGFS